MSTFRDPATAFGALTSTLAAQTTSMLGASTAAIGFHMSSTHETTASLSQVSSTVAEAVFTSKQAMSWVFPVEDSSEFNDAVLQIPIQIMIKGNCLPLATEEEVLYSMAVAPNYGGGARDAMR